MFVTSQSVSQSVSHPVFLKGCWDPGGQAGGALESCDELGDATEFLFCFRFLFAWMISDVPLCALLTVPVLTS